jgi:hypothetical protein
MARLPLATAAVAARVSVSHRADLTLVPTPKKPRYAEVAYSVLFDEQLSIGARLLWAVLETHWYETGVCFASHQTLAHELSSPGPNGPRPLSLRQLRRYLDELIAHGHIVERPGVKRQAKTYSPSASQQDTGVLLDGAQQDTGVSLSEPQSDTGVLLDHPLEGVQQDTGAESTRHRRRVNKTPVSDSIKQLGRNNSGETTAPTELSPPSASQTTVIPARELVSKPKRTKTEQRTTLPDDFAVTPDMRAWAVALGIPDDQSLHGIDEQTEAFKDHARAHRSVYGKWLDAWRNWMRGNAPGGRFAAPSPAIRNGGRPALPDRRLDRRFSALPHKHAPMPPASREPRDPKEWT